MQLTETHTTTSRSGTTKVTHYTHDGRPVRIIVHRDFYAFQSYGRVARWTDDRGYQVVITIDPAIVHADLTGDLADAHDKAYDAYLNLMGAAS